MLLALAGYQLIQKLISFKQYFMNTEQKQSSVSGLKWVKASERLPEEHGYYFCKIGKLRDKILWPKNTIVLMFNRPGIDIEWLEETPSVSSEIDNVGSEGSMSSFLNSNNEDDYGLYEEDAKNDARIIYETYKTMAECPLKEHLSKWFDFVASKEQPSASVASHSSGVGNSIQQELEYAMAECNRLSEVATYWQKKYYEVVPPQQPVKLDNL